MTVRELPRARFDGAARRVRGPFVALRPAAAVPLPREMTRPAVAAMPACGPHAVPESVARPAAPLLTAHIGNVPTASRVH
ncbi:hypothetical protein ACH4S8_09505 [Streptomyces sp. NPDC021080]|uniref:hypothetical protein n=1 Tax=Streptomyces sp. NPDC021080 TaxID=3365110 RepID=UPI00379EDB2A